MNPEMDQLKCGRCGGEEHNLYQVTYKDRKEIITQCKNCGLKSIIKQVPAELKIEFHKDSKGEGVLCGGWGR